MTEIRKDRKYILQFPEGTTVDEQKMVINKMEESLKSDDRFTVVDPKVKVYAAEKVIEEVEAAEKVIEEVEAPKPTETPTTPAVETPAPVIETPTETPAAPADGIKVEKIEVSSPKSDEPVKPTEPLSESGTSSGV